MRAVNTKLEQRKIVEITNFAGADFSSAPSRVSSNHASDMRNFIKENGLNHKRHGWKELFQIDFTVGNKNTKDYAISGIYPFQEGSTKVLIVVIGNCFFRVVKNVIGYTIRYLNNFYNDSYYMITPSLYNGKSQAFYQGDKLFIKTNSAFAVYSQIYIRTQGITPIYSYVLRNVTSMAYIPTTTISINPLSETTDINRKSHDAVNVLTYRRRNSLIGDSTQNELHQWVLDFQQSTSGAYLTYGFGRVRMEVKTPDTNPYVQNSILTCTYRNAPTNRADALSDPFTETRGEYLYLDTCVSESSNGVNYVSTSMNIDNCYEKKVDNVLHLFRVNTLGDTSGADDTDLGACSTLAKGEIWGNEGVVTLYSNVDVTPVVAGQDNIIIEFSARNKTAEERMSDLLNCGFGTTFGTSGNTERLFLAGEWVVRNGYGGYDLRKKNMEYYSEVGDYSYFPDLNYKEIGNSEFSIVGFQKLSDNVLAVFKGKNNGQESTIYYQTAKYYENYDEEGNIISARTDFPSVPGTIGETMVSREASLNFLGDNIVLSENGVFGIVLPDNIATSERYARERSRLINERLKKQTLQSATGIVYKNKYYLAVDGVCYVADSRYKFSGKDDIDNSFNYEWWFWDNIPAQVFAEANGKLLFGTGRGTICEFDDEYSDRELHNLEDGQYSYNASTGVFTVSSSEIDFIQENTVVSFSVNGGTFYVTDVEDGQNGGKRFKIKGTIDGEPLIINTPTKFYIWNAKNVVAEWYTPVIDLGNNMYSKTLLRMAITAESVQNGKMSFGYTTRNSNNLIDVKGINKFSFDNFSFQNFTFDTGFTKSYSVKCNERKFNYIVFRFLSDSDTDCAIDAFSFIYKVNRLNKGVM